ncbi:MAG: Gldg family protein [Eubacteriales bacterium]
MDKKPSENKLQNAKKMRMGSYSVIIALVVVAVCVVINLIIAKLPASVTKIDTSSLGIYSITDESKEIARGVAEDVTIYMVAESGAEDATITELVGRYTSLNSKIKFKTVDPALYPSFVAGYTTAALSGSSLIVESAKRSYVIDYNDIYVTNYSTDANGNATSSSSFAGESRITSALEYVTTDDIPVIYLTQGHGESALSDTMAGYIRDDNIKTDTVNLLTAEIPADADALFIYMPTADLSADEAAKIIEYLKNGGDLILITGYGADTDFSNLYSVGEYYGVHAADGLVIEGSSNNYYSYPYFLLPKLGSHAIADSMPQTAYYCMMPYAQGLTVDEKLPRDTINISKLMYTTNSAYLKAGDISDLTKADGDTEGPFDIALAVTEGDTKLLWFTSPYIIDDTIDYYTNGANSNYFSSSLMWMCGKESSVSIATKSMQVAALMLTETSANVWSVIVTALIPAAFIICGLVVWQRRRKA